MKLLWQNCSKKIIAIVVVITVLILSILTFSFLKKDFFEMYYEQNEKTGYITVNRLGEIKFTPNAKREYNNPDNIFSTKDTVYYSRTHTIEKIVCQHNPSAMKTAKMTFTEYMQFKYLTKFFGRSEACNVNHTSYDTEYMLRIGNKYYNFHIGKVSEHGFWDETKKSLEVHKFLEDILGIQEYTFPRPVEYSRLF